MYRRLKNLLGISLVILAMLISQLPMPEVEADVAQEPITVSEEVTNDATAIDDTSSDANPVSDTDTTDGDTMDDGTTDDDTTDDGTTDDDTTDDGTTDDGTTDDDTTTDGTGSTTPTTTMVTVTFDYRMTDLDNEIVEVDVSDGVAKTITAPTQFTVDQVENFGGVDMTFKGWYKDPNGGEAWDFTTMTVLNQDITLYAQWVRNDDAVARITYSATEASLYSHETVDVRLGECIPKPTKIPVRNGYEIDYWVVSGETTEVNWDQAVTGDLTLVAVWKAKANTLTLNLNGAQLARDYTYNNVIYSEAATKLEIPVAYGSLFTDILLTSDYIEYNGTELDDKWYTDSYALAEYNQSAQITKSITLYKRVVNAATKDSTGFEMNLAGTVLYHYEHPEDASDDVVIPSTVKVIGINAFDDLNGIKSITLPAGIEDIRNGAFSGAESLSSALAVYASDSTESKRLGKLLGDTYSYIEYKESTTTETATAKLDALNCSLYESNAATGEAAYPTYVSFLLPVGMESGSYSVAIEPNDAPITIDDLLAAIGITDSNRLYHMEITLQKDGRVYSNYSQSKTFTVILPLPQKWQGYALDGNTTVYTVSMDGTKLEKLTPTIITKDGIKCVKFEPYHFSEYVVYYGGTIDNSSSGNGGNNNSGGNNAGGNNSGNTNTGNNNGGSSNGGSSNTGGSNTGNSNTGSSNSGGSNSGSNSSGNHNSGSSNNSGSSSSSTPGTGSNNAGVGNGTGAGTGNTAVNNNGTGQGQGAGHVKDSTPKTGDPLEYRTMAVCILFSIGVMILLIGNEKKEKVSRTSRVLRG